MGAIDEIYEGTLLSAKKNDGQNYDDWRAAFIGKQGLICVYKSENIAKGKYFICFYEGNDLSSINDELNRLQTSPGNLFIDETQKEIGLKTDNSRYQFSFISRKR